MKYQIKKYISVFMADLAFSKGAKYCVSSMTGQI